MFKWKVSGLGGGSKKSKSEVKPEVMTKLNNGQSSAEAEASKNGKNTLPGKKDSKQK